MREKEQEREEQLMEDKKRKKEDKKKKEATQKVTEQKTKGKIFILSVFRFHSAADSACSPPRREWVHSN